jgi:hypothetical protein
MKLYRGEQLPVPASLAWSPTLRDDFHVPHRFGELVFREHDFGWIAIVTWLSTATLLQGYQAQVGVQLSGIPTHGC